MNWKTDMNMTDHQFEYYSATLKRNINIRCLILEGRNLKCQILLHGYNGDHHQWYVLKWLIEDFVPEEADIGDVGDAGNLN